MFWGLIMEPQRRYTQRVRKAFHISMASLDISTSSDEPAQVMCGIDGRNYLLCTLRKPDVLQCPLDLNFNIGTDISFAANGQCHVHLTGYLIEDFPDSGEEYSEEETEEEQEVEVEKPVKRKKGSARDSTLTNGPPSKKRKATNVADEEEEEDDNSDDSDDVNVEDLFQKSFDEDDVNDDTYMEEEESDEADEEEEDDDEEVEEEEDLSSMSGSEGGGNGDVEEEEEDEEPANVGKKAKKAPKLNGVAPKEQSTPVNKKEKKKKQAEEKKTKDDKTPNKEGKSPHKEQQSAKKKTLQGGVIIHDLKEGQGPIAKPGKFVTVYYEGRLKQNNKMFDSTTKGSGFSFRLGGGEVIKGWDIGVAGMRLGGKRKIICPPAMAYGAKGSPPAIPENSTLVFEVELKKMR